MTNGEFITLTSATQIDADAKQILTEEAGLLTGGSLVDDLEVGHPMLHRIERTVGRRNLRSFDKLVGAEELRSQEDFTGGRTVEDGLDYIRSLADWHRHLVSRELAVRTIELAEHTGGKVHNIRSILEAEFAGTRYNRRGLLGQLGDSFSVKTATKDVVDSLDEGSSLGDMLAYDRLRALGLAVYGVSDLVNSLQGEQGMELDSVPISDLKAFRDVLTGIGSAEDGSIRAIDLQVRFIEYQIKYMKLDGAAPAEAAAEAKAGIGAIRGLREQPQTGRLMMPDGRFVYIPSNMQDFHSEQELPKASESEVISVQESLEARLARLAEARRALAEKADQNRRYRLAAEETRGKEIAEHDQPILEKLNQLAEHHNQIIAEFTAQSGRELREKGFAGDNSLEYELRQCKSVGQDGPGRIVRVYSRLSDMAGGDVTESVAALSEALNSLVELRAEYESFKNQNRLQGTEKPDELMDSIKPELTWLADNYQQLQKKIQTSRHRQFATSKKRYIIAKMLGVETEAGDECVYEAVDSSKATEPEIGPLESANSLAETLNYVVLPSESITVEDLVENADQAIRSRSDGRDQKPAQVERYRMEALLKLRDEYGGTLYRSNEKTLGDSDNLYYVLRFQHEGDDRFYAVAENPTYGNATYVLCEDTLPLTAGETVLTAVRESRQTVRDLGAQRVYHTSGDALEHIKAIETKIARLSELEPVAG